MGHRQQGKAYRGLLDLGPAGLVWGLFLVVTAAGAVAILIWLFYALLTSLY